MHMKDELQQKQGEGSVAGKLWSKPELKVLLASSENIEVSFGPVTDAAFSPSSTS